ncbi:MAG: DUF6666 family protein [Thermoguttaceae bacterium]|jgi:hypothetical protein
MTSPNEERNREIQTPKGNGRNLLTNALRRHNVLTAGFVSALALLGCANFASESYAQQTRHTQAASTPWTGQNGREIIDLNARPAASPTPKKDVAKKAPSKPKNYIRQIQAEIPRQDLFGGGLEELPDNPVFDSAPLEDPTSIPAPLTEAPRNVIKTPEVAPNYPQGEVARQTAAAPARTEARLEAPNAYSANPYSQIGQAEYNPGYFYGTAAPNASINGYRNTAPAIAYGQNPLGCGDPCQQGCYGLFGGFFENTQLGAGFDAMRSPLDLEDAGNYGADFSLNWASPQAIIGGFHLQAGARGVFTDFNGVEANGFTTGASRNQFFWTAGAYYRANQYAAEGLSLGVVYDSVRDTYYRKYELQQMRTELSYMFGGTLTIGFRGAFGLDNDWCDLLKLDEDLVIEAKASASDYYTGFMRWAFAQGGEATIYGGATQHSEGLIGGSVEAPISDSFTLKFSGLYVFPTDRGLTHREEETWSMSMGLVWYVGGGARNTACSPRPLFDVADNTSFLQNFDR